MSTKKKWFVVYTKPRWEKKIAAILVEMGIENYCPLNRVHRQWSDRRKKVFEPLFKGYVFVAPDDNLVWEIKKINGVLNYVHWLGKPAVIRQKEIDTIKKFLEEFDDVEVQEQAAAVNDTVQVKQGIMMNYKGMVLELIGNKARVKIESMGLQLIALFERKNLQKVGKG